MGVTSCRGWVFSELLSVFSKSAGGWVVVGLHTAWILVFVRYQLEYSYVTITSFTFGFFGTLVQWRQLFMTGAVEAKEKSVDPERQFPQWKISCNSESSKTGNKYIP